MFKMRLGIANVKVYKYAVEKSIDWLPMNSGSVLWYIQKNMLMPCDYLQNHTWSFLVLFVFKYCFSLEAWWSHFRGNMKVYSEKNPLSLTAPSCYSTFMTSVEGGILKNLVEFTFSWMCKSWELEIWCVKKWVNTVYTTIKSLISKSFFGGGGDYYFYLTEMHQKLQYIHVQYVTKDFCFK